MREKSLNNSMSNWRDAADLHIIIENEYDIVIKSKQPTIIKISSHKAINNNTFIFYSYAVQ